MGAMGTAELLAVTAEDVAVCVPSVTSAEFRQSNRTNCATIAVDHLGGVDQTARPGGSHARRLTVALRIVGQARRPLLANPVPRSRAPEVPAPPLAPPILPTGLVAQPHTSFATSAMSLSLATSSS